MRATRYTRNRCPYSVPFAVLVHRGTADDALVLFWRVVTHCRGQPIVAVGQQVADQSGLPRRNTLLRSGRASRFTDTPTELQMTTIAAFPLLCPLSASSFTHSSSLSFYAPPAPILPPHSRLDRANLLLARLSFALPSRFNAASTMSPYLYTHAPVARKFRVFPRLCFPNAFAEAR